MRREWSERGGGWCGVGGMMGDRGRGCGVKRGAGGGVRGVCFDPGARAVGWGWGRGMGIRGSVLIPVLEPWGGDGGGGLRSGALFCSPCSSRGVVMVVGDGDQWL